MKFFSTNEAEPLCFVPRLSLGNEGNAQQAILNQLKICSAVNWKSIPSSKVRWSLPWHNSSCWLDKKIKTERSSGSSSHPSWEPYLKQCRMLPVTRLELWSGDRISIVQSGAINTSSTGSPSSSNSIRFQRKTAISGTIDIIRNS